MTSYSLSIVTFALGRTFYTTLQTDGDRQTQNCATGRLVYICRTVKFEVQF